MAEDTSEKSLIPEPPVGDAFSEGHTIQMSPVTEGATLITPRERGLAEAARKDPKTSEDLTGQQLRVMDSAVSKDPTEVFNGVAKDAARKTGDIKRTESQK